MPDLLSALAPDRQHPTGGRLASSQSEMWAIVTHPAFRLGFLDARGGHQFDHEDIIARMLSETPEGALRRLGWMSRFVAPHEIDLAQCRYEEGRFAWTAYQPRVRAWGHPDFPPVALQELIRQLADERALADA